jgi:hypothetical protein
MHFLQLDDMLELVKYEQAELRHQVAREALLPPGPAVLGGWSAILGRVRSVLPFVSGVRTVTTVTRKASASR